MKLTRRQLVPSLVAGAAVTAALTQTTDAQTADTDFAKAARDSVQSNMDALAKFSLPISTEPAFQFKA